jgi:putative colanic acid biosynthesis acetyltransferase WcaF
MERNLSRFTYQKSIPAKIKVASWAFFQNSILTWFFFPSWFRKFALRLFGAKIGRGVLIRKGVRIHFPWNLSIGDHVWIGENVWIINHAPITISSNVCISQNVILCSSGHDFRSESLEFAHGPILIKEGAWICLRATVLANTEVGMNSVVSAGEVLDVNLPDNTLYRNSKSFNIEY